MENFLTLWRKIWPLLVSGCVYLIGQYFRGEWFVGTNLQRFCHSYFENGKIYCNSPYLDFGVALIVAGIFLAATAIILLFANSAGYRKWLRLSYWYVPLAAVIIFALFPAHFFQSEIGRDTVTRDLGVLYVLITLGIVLFSRRKG